MVSDRQVPERRYPHLARFIYWMTCWLLVTFCLTICRLYNYFYVPMWLTNTLYLIPAVASLLVLGLGVIAVVTAGILEGMRRVKEERNKEGDSLEEDW